MALNSSIVFEQNYINLFLTDACEKPVDEGPCQGNFSRWAFDKESGSCSTFNYGGCKGNNNNFLSELACQQKCLQPGRSRGKTIYVCYSQLIVLKVARYPKITFKQHILI